MTLFGANRASGGRCAFAQRRTGSHRIDSRLLLLALLLALLLLALRAGRLDGPRVVRSCRRVRLRPCSRQAVQCGHRSGLLAGEQVPVGVHRQRDRAVPHDGLHGFGMGTRHCQPRAAGPPFAYLLARTTDFRSFAIQQMTGSSGRQRVPADSLSKYKLVTPEPNDSLFVQFGKMITPMFRSMTAAMNQSRTLAALRDALLPKLISGELRVPDAARIVGRAM